jgi:hypothetical protein
MSLIPPLKSTLSGGGLHIFQTLNRGLDRFKVGQHSPKPALINEGHTSTASLLSDDLSRLTLGAHEHHGAATL